MEYFPSTYTPTESAFLIERMEAGFERDGFGLWAVEPKGECSSVGFVGLNPAPEEMPFAPAVEIGWRLARSHWGRGIATEAAQAAVRFGFEEVGLEEIVSFTFAGNVRSRAVMERLGMTRDPDEDFAHPLLPPNSPLSRHVLYRLGPKRP
jgi:RimJ/RimL family protein N-acetyltransferase